MNGRNNGLVHLQQGKIFFHHRGRFNQGGTFIHFRLFIYDPGAGFAVILITVMGGFAGIVFDQYFMAIADQHAYGFGRKAIRFS